MKLTTTTALALVAAISAPAAAQTHGNAPQQQQQAQVTVKPSKQALKAIIDLQDAVNKKDFASVPGKVAAAEAVASTKEDRYLIGTLQLKAAAASNDAATLASAIEKVAQSGFLDPAKTASLYASLGGTYFNNKQYPQAAAAYQKAVALDPNDMDSARLLGLALFQEGQKAEAAAVLQKAIQTSASRGQKPSDDLYRLAVQSAFDAKSPAAADLARQWVAAYPSADSWSNAIAIYRALNKPDVEGTVDLYRLLLATGSLKSGGEYAQYARAAAAQNNYNEAQAAYDAGVAAKAIDPKSAEYSDLVAGLKAKQKATAADLAVATKTAVNGMALLRIGDRYYAMGDYAKAAELSKMAMGKAGVDNAVANLHLGMALARAGDKAGATAAFNAVTGPRADIAKFWLTYLNQKA